LLANPAPEDWNMLPSWIRPVLFSAVLAGASACGGAPETPAPTPEPAPEPAAAPEAPPSLDLATLQAQAQNIALTPSPAEMQAALSKAQITQSLAEIVKQREIDMDTPNQDRVAVRTGVLVADVVLTIKTAEKADLVARLEGIKKGMQQLGGGADIDNTIADLINRIQNDAVSRDELVKDMDELAGVIIPEVEYEAGEKVVPLIQAGSWLEGANLVSSAVITAGKYDAANALLKQPEVVRYFRQYVKIEGDAAPDEVVAKLEQTLGQLEMITSGETLGEEEVKTINEQTDAVLALL
jgi:hypothetical protein